MHTYTSRDLHLEEGDTAVARSVYNSIPQQYNISPEEYTEFTQWGHALLNLRIALLAANRSPKDLTQGEKAMLQTIADSAAMWAKVRAQNWLSLIDGVSQSNEFLYPEEGAQRPGGGATPVIQTVAGNDKKVWPNPMTDFLQVDFPQDGGSIEIYSLDGRNVFSQKLQKGRQQLDIRQLPEGFYIYRLKQGNSTLETGKLTKQNR